MLDDPVPNEPPPAPAEEITEAEALRFAEAAKFDVLKRAVRFTFLVFSICAGLGSLCWWYALTGGITVLVVLAWIGAIAFTIWSLYYFVWLVTQAICLGGYTGSSRWIINGIAIVLAGAGMAILDLPWWTSLFAFGLALMLVLGVWSQFKRLPQSDAVDAMTAALRRVERE